MRKARRCCGSGLRRFPATVPDSHLAVSCGCRCGLLCPHRHPAYIQAAILTLHKRPGKGVGNPRRDLSCPASRVLLFLSLLPLNLSFADSGAGPECARAISVSDPAHIDCYSALVLGEREVRRARSRVGQAVFLLVEMRRKSCFPREVL